MGVSGYYPVIIRSSFSPDRYPVDYYPVLSGIRQNNIQHIPRKPPPPLTNQSRSAQEAGFSGILLAVKLLHIFKHAL